MDYCQTGTRAPVLLHVVMASKDWPENPTGIVLSQGHWGISRQRI